MLSHAVTPLESDCCFLMCFVCILCFMFPLRTKNILDKPQQMHCLITVVAMVLYLTKKDKKKKEKRITFKKLTCWPSPVKNFPM